MHDKSRDSALICARSLNASWRRARFLMRRGILEIFWKTNWDSNTKSKESKMHKDASLHETIYTYNLISTFVGKNSATVNVKLNYLKVFYEVSFYN